MKHVSTHSVALAGLLSFACSGSSGYESAESSEPPPAHDPITEQGLRGIWGSGSDDVWAVGAEGTIVHYDGTAWSSVESGTTRDLLDVTGTGRDDVWAAGDDVILRGNGSEWNVAIEAINELLLSAWSGVPNDVWVAGIATDVNRGVIRHWDGEAWEFAVTGSAHSLWAIWGSSADTIWSGGTNASDPGGFLVRGGVDPFDFVDYAGPSPRGIWGSSELDVWIAPYEGDIHHYDGTEWQAVGGRTERALAAVHGTGPDDIWCVGHAGTILHWDGQAWSVVPSGTEENLFDVWAFAPDDAWIAGGHGTILHWDGNAWAP